MTPNVYANEQFLLPTRKRFDAALFKDSHFIKLILLGINELGRQSRFDIFGPCAFVVKDEALFEIIGVSRIETAIGTFQYINEE